jgi:hypothetical protein
VGAQTHEVYGHPNAIADVVYVWEGLEFRVAKHKREESMKNGRDCMKRQFRIGWSPLLLCLGTMVMLTGSLAQTIISGDITGVVTDPTGAILTNARVTLTSLESGAIQTVKTDSTGGFRFPLLRPSDYRLEVTAHGFESVSQKVTAAIGQVVPANMKVSVKGTSELVEVSGATPLLETETLT